MTFQPESIGSAAKTLPFAEQSCVNAQTRVFVYGTLKPGEENYAAYCRDRVVFYQEGYVLGQLYDLPMGYPAMTTGDRPVYGFVISFAEPTVLNLLDELEEFDPHRPAEQNEYQRIQVEVFNLEHTSLGLAWVYVMSEQQAQRLEGIFMPNGRWSGQPNTH